MIKNLKLMVENSLRDDIDSRNSDIRLTNYIWLKYYSDSIQLTDKNEYYVKLSNLYYLPKQDDVGRWRQKFQNEKGIYLPTDPEVRKQRRMKEIEIRKELGFNPEFVTVQDYE